MTDRQSIILFKHCLQLEKKIIKTLKLNNFDFRAQYKKKYKLSKEQLQLVRPICIEEKKYREKYGFPNPIWAFVIIEEYFILEK